MSYSVKRTYGRQMRTYPPSSPASSPPAKRRRVDSDDESSSPPPIPQRAILKPKKIIAPPKLKPKMTQSKLFQSKKTTLKQLHFVTEGSTLRACPRCDLSYTRGAPDDEALHKTHCARVVRGLEWGNEEETSSSTSVVEEDIRLKSGEVGRIVVIQPRSKGKVAAKLTQLLKTVNLALSSPDLTTEAYDASKVYLFLLKSKAASRERIVGCVIAQRIETALVIATSEEDSENLVCVDTGLFCRPEQLSTPLGISRIFVSSSHRRQNVARHLLDAVARNFIHGCPLDPAQGQVAFSQPTGLGKMLMTSWGKAGVRVFQE